MTGLLLLTFRELWAKKITLGLFLISTLVWLMMVFALNLDIVEGTIAGIRIFGFEQGGPEPEAGASSPNALSLDRFVIVVEQFVAGAAYVVGILLGLFATAPLLPGLLEEGRAGLMLSKPLSRTQLLAGHVLGVWLAVLILALYLIVMVWLVLALKTGIWHPRFLISALVVTGMFAVLYSAVVLISVGSQSTALALIGVYGLIFVSLFFVPHEQLAIQIDPPWRYLYLGLYHLLPNFAEGATITAQLAGAAPVTDWYPLLSSLLFGAAAYSGAAVWFHHRDF